MAIKRLIGPGGNQVSLNRDLGTLAFQDANAALLINPTVGGNLAFTGTGNRITGDFSNATDANRVAFQTSTANGGTRVNILSNGTGTASSLDVFGVSDPTNAAVLRIRQSGTESQIQASITGTGTYLPLTMFTGGSERLRIDTSGNVGIGTTSPAVRLNVVGGNGIIARFKGTDGPNLKIESYSSNNEVVSEGGNLLVGTTSGALQLYTGTGTATERMRITSGGLVGINTTTPDTRLDVSSSTADELTSVFTKGLSDLNFRVGFMNGVAGSTGTIQGRMGLFYLGVGEAASVRFVRGATTTDSSLVFATNGTERLRVPSDAGGLTFPATQAASSDANTLDDYEEGTWTPSLGGTATYTYRQGNYTKIGNLVHIYCLLNCNTIGTGSVNTITGLPFNAVDRGAGSLAYFGSLSKNVVFLSPFADGATVKFDGTTAAAAGTTDPIDIFQNSAYVIFSATYRVA